MQSTNKWLNRSFGIGSVLGGLALGLTCGCQASPLSWLGAQNSSQLPITIRQQSLAQTPMAVAYEQSTKRNQALTESIDRQAIPQTRMTPPSPVQLASANSPEVNPSQADPISNAVHVPSLTATGGAVIPEQYSQLGPTGSKNVPRIAMGPTIMPLPPGRVSNPNIPRTQSASSMRPHSHSGGNCATCNAGSVYKPIFSRFSGNQGCTSCGTQSCSGECKDSMVEQGFAVPRASDPQEYIFDGGDHNPQVRLKADLSQVGLDPEDTVIQYETADGKTSVESGCRVAIYAPRFASIRKRQSTRENELAMRALSTLRPDGPGVLREQLPAVNVSQPVKLMNSDTVRVVEAFRERNRPMPAELVLPMVTISDAFKPYEDLSLIRNGDLKSTDLAKLSKSAAAARTWTNVDELNVLIDGQEAIEASGVMKEADVTLYEFKGARIRLCKVASEQMANPGDVVSFTIRFDNVGEQPLKSLVVTDSLAPRLEYVEKSQQSSVAANFSTTPNSAGSSVLRWELENGLKPGEGGLVRFSCKVR